MSYMPYFTTKLGKRFLVHQRDMICDTEEAARLKGNTWFEAALIGAKFGGTLDIGDDMQGYQSEVSAAGIYVPVFIPDPFSEDWAVKP